MMQKVRVNSIVFKFRKHTVLGSQRSTHLTMFVSCQSFSLKFPTVAVPNSLWHFITEFHINLSVYVMITSSAEVWGTSFVCTINCCYTEKRFFSSLFKKIRKRDWNFLFFFEKWTHSMMFEKDPTMAKKVFRPAFGWSKYTTDVNWFRLI